MESKFKQAEERFIDAVRTELASEVSQLPDGWQRTFKLMYGRNNGKRSVADAEALTIGEVVAEIPADKLDWAVQQVENSRIKLGRAEAGKQLADYSSAGCPESCFGCGHEHHCSIAQDGKDDAA